MDQREDRERSCSTPRADITDRSKTDTYHQADILDFPNAHVNALPLIHRQTDVDEVVFVGHAADLHEGKEVTVVVTAFRLQGLERAQSNKAAVSLGRTSTASMVRVGKSPNTGTTGSTGSLTANSNLPLGRLHASLENISSLGTFLLKFLIVWVYFSQ